MRSLTFSELTWAEKLRNAGWTIVWEPLELPKGKKAKS